MSSLLHIRNNWNCRYKCICFAPYSFNFAVKKFDHKYFFVSCLRYKKSTAKFMQPFSKHRKNGLLIILFFPHLVIIRFIPINRPLTDIVPLRNFYHCHAALIPNNKIIVNGHPFGVMFLPTT